jgi:hypothetical protein
MTTNNSNQQIIKIVIGSQNSDGRKDCFMFSSNHDGKAWKEAVEKAEKQLKISLDDDVASEWEHPYMFESDYQTLKQNGWNVAELEVEEEPKGVGKYDEEFATPEHIEKLKGPRRHIYVEEYLDLYLFLVKFGNPDIEMEPIEEGPENYIHAGGHGLFY